MSEPRFTSHVRVSREHPPLRTAELLETGETVTFGTPGYQGDFYGFGEGELRERGGTFDYLLASVAACLTGTLGRALTVRGIPSDGDRLTSRAEAEVVVEDGVMVMRPSRSATACRWRRASARPLGAPMLITSGPAAWPAPSCHRSTFARRST